MTPANAGRGVGCSRRPPSLPDVLAHQGGWDEALFVAAPLAVFAGMLLVARRRALAETDAEGDGGATETQRDRTDPCDP